MSAIELELYELLKAKLGEKETKALFTLVENKIEDRKSELATKEDLAALESRLLRTIYLVNIVQLLAIVGSVTAIVHFMMK